MTPFPLSTPIQKNISYIISGTIVKEKQQSLIAHRISTVQHADLIMVLENGEMKELGTHTELIQKNGIYKDMFEKQQLEASIGEQEVAIR